jgi:hypothetical protein
MVPDLIVFPPGQNHIVAGTDDDVNNLSIVMTARQLQPDLLVVLRQNLQANQPAGLSAAQCQRPRSAAGLRAAAAGAAGRGTAVAGSGNGIARRRPAFVRR